MSFFSAPPMASGLPQDVPFSSDIARQLALLAGIPGDMQQLAQKASSNVEGKPFYVPTDAELARGLPPAQSTYFPTSQALMDRFGVLQPQNGQAVPVGSSSPLESAYGGIPSDVLQRLPELLRVFRLGR